MRSVYVAIALLVGMLVPQSAGAQTPRPAGTSSSAPVSSTGPTLTPQQEAEARGHFERGVGLFNRGDHNGALAEFQAAYDLSRRPTVLFNLGVTNQQLGRYPEAARQLDQYLREAPNITPDRRQQVERAVAEIRQYVARITLTGVPDGAVIRVDGERAGVAPLPGPIAVATGRRVITVSADGFLDATETVLIAGGQDRTVEVQMRRAGDGRVISGNMALLAVRGTPERARVLVDGSAVTTGAPLELRAGPHELRVEADGFLPATRSVTLAAREERSAEFRLVPAGRWGLLPFIVGASATGAFGIVGIACGILTLGTKNEFEGLYRDDPRAPQLAATGTTQAILTNVFLGAAALSGGFTVFALTRTNFGPRESRLNVAAVPVFGPGTVGALGRF